MKKSTLVGLTIIVALAVSLTSPALAFGEPKQEAWYTFQLNPFIDIIHLNTNPDNWLNGYDEAAGVYIAPVLGKREGGKAYIAIDFPVDIYYDMALLVIDVATKDGYSMRIRDDLSLTGPDYIWLTPVTEQSTEGPTLGEAEGSLVTPRAWHTFQVNPWPDIYDLCSDLKPWLWGWSNTDPLGPILGYVHGGRFFLATDFPDGMMYYELAFKAGTVATRDGYNQRTVDGMSYDFDYFWLTPV